MNIIFDLDGTLIDSKPRLHQLFQHLVPESKLSFSEYWELKFAGHSNETIVSDRFGFNARAVTEFRRDWMALIESPSFLERDVNFTGIHEALDELKESARLYVCTARQFVNPVHVQLEALNLLGYFDEVMVTEQRNTKEFLIAQKVSNLTSHDWVVGDTGKDVQVGMALGVNTCAVLTGFMTADALSRYSPKIILESVIEFKL
ncbi:MULTISPECIES: HAD hydrolase-like protein [Pseudomonas]|uniref:HAD hydrolase-like protein n=1 Tax=Pseudomonas TaxID=286 RepID=UPI0016462A54|nr:HAD family hydrolase [Pseudomonas paralactis]MBJ2220085.1 HAD family hydrolase [Pseudomonas sp. MF7453]